MSSRKTVVAVRLVRLHDETTAEEDGGAVSIPDENCLRVIPPQSSKNQNQDNGVEARDYNFDYVYSSELEDEDEPEHLMQKIGSVPVQRCLGGESSLVFGYGANATGVSHALIGNLENPGLLPRMFQRVFEALAEVPEHYTASGPAHAEVSCYHVLSDTVYDLLAPASQKTEKSPRRTAGGRGGGDGGADGTGGAGKLESFGDPGERCRVRESPRHGAFVENITTVVVRSDWRRAFDLLREGQSRRTRASTSNRCLSHLVFMFNVQCSGLSLGGTSTGQIQFVSFAPIATTMPSRGGDSFSKMTSTVSATSDKLLLPSPALKSAMRCIGSSLSTLHRVVASLAKKQKHVPYRDSMLTRLLKRSLSGRAHTTLLATVTPTKDMVAETLSTLRFASNISQLTVATNIRLMPASEVQTVLLEKIKGIEHDLMNSDAGNAEDAGMDVDGAAEDGTAAKSSQHLLIDEAAENDRKLREEMERLRREVDLLAGLLDIDALLSIEIEYRSESNRRHGDAIVSSYLATSDDTATGSSTVVSTAESLEADSLSTSHDEDAGEQEARASPLPTQTQRLDQAPSIVFPVDGLTIEASSEGITDPATPQRSNKSKSPELEPQRLRSFSAPIAGLEDSLPLIAPRELPTETADMQATLFIPQESRASTTGGTSSPARRPGLPSKTSKRTESEPSPSRHGRMESAGRRVIRNNQRARREASDQRSASQSRGGGRERGAKTRGMGATTTATTPVQRTGVRPGKRAPTLPPAKGTSRAGEASSEAVSANPASSMPPNESLDVAARVFRELMIERRKAKLLLESEAREDNKEEEEEVVVVESRNGWLPSAAQEDVKVSPSLFPSPSGLAPTKDAPLVPSLNADVLAANHQLANIKSEATHDADSLRVDSSAVADDFDLSISGASRQWKADMKMALQWAERNEARKEQKDAKATKVKREMDDESVAQRPTEEGQRTPELLSPLPTPALPLEIGQNVIFESSTSVEWVTTPRPDDPEDIEVIVPNEPSRPFRSTAAALFDQKDNATSDDTPIAPALGGDGDPRVDPTWYDRKPPDANARESMFLRAVMRGRNQEAIDLYAAGGLRLDVVNSFGRNAVHIAARNGNTAFLVWLGENFADFHLVSMSGDTAFHVAAWNGHVASMDYLCQTQALDCMARTVLDGDTPAHLAARRGEMRALKWLSRMGADLWAKNHYGTTPWHQTPRCFENVRTYLQAQQPRRGERPEQAGFGSGMAGGWLGNGEGGDDSVP